MVSEENLPVYRSMPALRITNGFFSLIFGISGLLQISVSAGLFRDPSGIISHDILGGLVMIVISVLFTAGVLKTRNENAGTRSFFLVGSFLAVIHGLTGLLIAISNSISKLSGLEEGSVNAADFAEPSIILSVMIILLITFSKLAVVSSRRRFAE